MYRRNFLWNSIFLFLLIMVTDANAIETLYTIGPGDTLEISVWRDESLSRDVIVPPDGVISFPLVGDINVVGMTVSTLRKTVTKNLADYVPDATVTVILKTYLTTGANEKVRPKLEQELKLGARIVTHDFSIPNWEDELSYKFRESYRNHTIYLYKKF